MQEDKGDNAGAGSIRLMLVEDDMDCAQAITDMLEKRRVSVEVISNAERALQEFEKGKFDVVVADIRLGGMSGVDMLRIVREKDGEFPFILLTGFDSLETAIQAVRLGAHDYIVKPLDSIDDLLVPVRSAVRNYRLLLRNAMLEKEQEKARAALAESHSELRMLAARLAETAEAERKRLGIELHDRIGQSLAALNLNFSALQSRSPGKTDPQTGKIFEDIRSILKDMAECVRNVLAELRPPMLDDYGLSASLRWYASTFAARSGISVKADFPDFETRLDPKVELALFRIAQEALSNVVRHAVPCEAELRLEEKPGTVVLTIKDGGPGFDLSRKGRERGRGWGLVSMRERAIGAGAELEIQTNPGSGTRITVIARRNGTT